MDAPGKFAGQGRDDSDPSLKRCGTDHAIVRISPLAACEVRQTLDSRATPHPQFVGV